MYPTISEKANFIDGGKDFGEITGKTIRRERVLFEEKQLQGQMRETEGLKV